MYLLRVGVIQSCSLSYFVVALRERDFMMRGGRDCSSISTLTQPYSPCSSHISCITGFYHFSTTLALLLDLPVTAVPSLFLTFNFFLQSQAFSQSLSPHMFFCYRLFPSFSLLPHFTLSFLPGCLSTFISLCLSSLPHGTLPPGCMLVCM